MIKTKNKNPKRSRLSLRFSTVFLCLTASLLFSLSVISQTLGVSATGTPPDPSAGLDVDFNNKGVLMPRLTTAERDAIVSPANGLMIYNKDCNIFQFYDNGNWTSFPALLNSPNAIAGTNIGETDFDANWSASSGATTYYLDVATDIGFTTFVSGFKSLNVGNVTTHNVTGLTCETDYYYRVRSVCGTSNYSSTINVTASTCWCSPPITDSRDSKTYQIVQIGSQCWMKENLNYNPGSGTSWCYNNNNSNCTTYGRLYNWNTAMNSASSSSSNPSGVQGVCPTGWHLASDVEWCQMENAVEV